MTQDAWLGWTKWGGGGGHTENSKWCNSCTVDRLGRYFYGCFVGYAPFFFGSTVICLFCVACVYLKWRYIIALSTPNNSIIFNTQLAILRFCFFVTIVEPLSWYLKPPGIGNRVHDRHLMFRKLFDLLLLDSRFSIQYTSYVRSSKRQQLLFFQSNIRVPLNETRKRESERERERTCREMIKKTDKRKENNEWRSNHTKKAAVNSWWN